MGSLMAGWSSQVLDPETVLLLRNKSLTKEEIESFWKSTNKEVKEKLEEDSQSRSNSPKTPPAAAAAAAQEDKNDSTVWHRLHWSSGVTPAVNPAEAVVAMEKHGNWWMRSKWAYLNEPPRDRTNGSSYKYMAQFQVAELASP